MNALKSSGILRQHARILQRAKGRQIQSKPNYVHLFKEFNATYPALKTFLCSKIEEDWARETYSQVLDHQLQAGRQIKPAIVLKSHEVMTAGYSTDADVELGSLQRIHVMAWIVETLNAAILLMDDFIDSSKLRRGEIPWYVGREDSFSNDLVLMALTPYHLLHGWFGNDSFYHSAATLLQKHACSIAIGQMAEKYVFDLFKTRRLTFEIYKSYCISKTFYTTELPFKLAAFESTKLDLQFDELTNTILEDIAYLYQLENDAMNVLPQEVSHGKDIDEDIKAGKVTWGLTFLMNNATEQDQKVMTEHYAKDDQRSVDIIRELYEKYNIPNETKEYMEKLKTSLRKKIRMVPNEHKFQEGLAATLETQQLYTECDPSIKNLYPKE